MYDHHNQEI